jgi:hypothetical protein
MTYIPLNRMKRNGKFEVWDLGPQVAPKAPPAPDGPDQKLKGAELAAAELEYEDACEAYKDKLRAYTAARKAHREWQEEKGGPIKLEMWGCDLRNALAVEPDRYVIDLPKGMKPGRAQIEAEKMEAAEAEEIARARSRDPMHMHTGATP